MSTLLLVMTDGRAELGYLQRTLEAFDRQVTGTVTRRVIHDDSGDPAYADWLRGTYPDYEVITAGRVGSRSGFDGAIRSAWEQVSAMVGYEWVFWLEEDFEFVRPVDLDVVADVLERCPHLAQMAFRRQACYVGEPPLGFAGVHATEMEPVSDGAHEWLQHRRLFTTNPNLHHRSLMKVGWPSGSRSEDQWWRKLRSQGLPSGVAGRDVRVGFWGSLTGGADWVRHIGEVRTGHRY